MARRTVAYSTPQQHEERLDRQLLRCETLHASGASDAEMFTAQSRLGALFAARDMLRGDTRGLERAN